MNTSKNRIAIIGNGIVGKLFAYKLCRKGFEVDLFEKGTPKASMAAQGLSSVKGLVFSRANLFHMKMLGHSLLAKLLNEFQDESETVFLKKNCVFEPFLDSNDETEVRRRVFGGQFSSLLNFKRTKAPYPLSSKWASSLLYPDDFVYSATQILNYLDNFLNQNSKINRRNHASRMAKRGSEFEVVSDDFEGEFDDVVLAAGAQNFSFCQKSSIQYPGFRIVSGETMDLKFDLKQESFFAYIRGKSSLVGFENSLRFGASSFSKVFPHTDENISRSRNEIKDLAALFLYDRGQNVQEIGINFGERVCHANMLPVFERSNFKDGSSGPFLISGMYKNGYQFAPLAWEKYSEKWT